MPQKLLPKISLRIYLVVKASFPNFSLSLVQNSDQFNGKIPRKPPSEKFKLLYHTHHLIVLCFKRKINLWSMWNYIPLFSIKDTGSWGGCNASWPGHIDLLWLRSRSFLFRCCKRKLSYYEQFWKEWPKTMVSLLGDWYVTMLGIPLWSRPQPSKYCHLCNPWQPSERLLHVKLSSQPTLGLLALATSLY